MSSIGERNIASDYLSRMGRQKAGGESRVPEIAEP